MSGVIRIVQSFSPRPRHLPLAAASEKSAAAPHNRVKTATVEDTPDLYSAHQKTRLAAGRIKPRTFEYSEASVKRCEPLVAARLQSLSTDDVESFSDVLAQTDAKPTARGVFLTLRKALALAVRSGLITANPATDVEPPSPPPPAEVVHATEDMVAEILEKAEDPWYSLFLTIAYTGMRTGEARGLRWDNVTISKESVVITITESSPEQTGTTKTRRPRVIQVPPIVAERVRELYLEQGAPGDGLLFPCALDRSNTSAAFRTVAPTGLTLKSLRHGVATRLAATGVPIRTIAQLLGNSPAVILAVYAHSLEDMEAAALESL